MSGDVSRLMRIAGAAAIATTVLVSICPTRLFAADLDSSYFLNSPPAQTKPVEFGTGWYIRGDLGYAYDSLPDVNPLGLFPVPSSYHSTFSVSLGAGYEFNRWFRADITGDYREPLSAYDPTTTTNANGGRWDVLANGYIDLGTWYGFKPYIGAGIGAAWGLTKITTADPAVACTQGGSIQCFANHIPASLAWALMAGVAYEIYPHAFLDIGYRYLNLGTYSFYDSNVWSQFGPGAGLPAAQSHIQEIRVGIRYMID